MADIFLMGSMGDSGWREPIKVACDRLGVTYFDPAVPEWNEAAKQRETEALQTAKVIVMAITRETASVAGLAESGWAFLSAVTRQQAFGLYIDPLFEDTSPEARMLETLSIGARTPIDTLEDASKRARKLVISHAKRLATQFPQLKFYLAPSLQSLQEWAIRTAREMTPR